jgi:hypothetical protein
MNQYRKQSHFAEEKSDVFVPEKICDMPKGFQVRVIGGERWTSGIDHLS